MDENEDEKSTGKREKRSSVGANNGPSPVIGKHIHTPGQT